MLQILNITIVIHNILFYVLIADSAAWAVPIFKDTNDGPNIYLALNGQTYYVIVRLVFWMCINPNSRARERAFTQ